MKEELEKLEHLTHDESVRAELKANMGEYSPDAMVIIDLSGKIWMVNAAAVRFFRYSREEMIGQEVEMLLPERFREKHKQYRKTAWNDQRSREMGNRTLTGLTKDGEEFNVDIQLTWPEFRHGIFGMAVLRKPRGESTAIPK